MQILEQSFARESKPVDGVEQATGLKRRTVELVVERSATGSMRGRGRYAASKTVSSASLSKANVIDGGSGLLF